MSSIREVRASLIWVEGNRIMQLQKGGREANDTIQTCLDSFSRVG